MKKQAILIILTVILIVGTLFIFSRQTGTQEATIEDITRELPEESLPPTFSEIPVNFTNVYDKSSLSFAGGSLIDVDGDGTDEVFVGGGRGQDDALLRFNGTAFVNEIDLSGLSNSAETFGSVSIDIDGDDDSDLFVAREDGIYLYVNNGGTFDGSKLDVTFAPQTLPIALAASDINHDGFVDLYVSTFIASEAFRPAVFNDPNHAKPNVMLLNNGDNTFTDITDESGLAVSQNTILSVFVDLDGDGWQDLVVSPNTDTLKIFKNKTDGTFTEIPEQSVYGFWMGLAVGDVDLDGDQDLFFSNTGKTVPKAVARGDLRADQQLDSNWRLLRNDGDFAFTDITQESGLQGFEFAWGVVFEDFNLDGRLDLSVAENYIKWPPHKINKLAGRMFWQDSIGTFVPITRIAGVENRYYGMTPLVSDFNADGYPDLVYINLDGPVRAFLNNGGANHFVKIVIQDSASSLGASVTLTKLDGTIMNKQVVTSTGMLSDQSDVLTFGIGRDESVQSVIITWPDGRVETIREVEIDQQIVVK